MTSTVPRLGILISQRGSNMQAFLRACEEGTLPAQLAVVISNNPEAPGLSIAANADIPTHCINHRDYDSREAFDAALVNALIAHDIDVVILAGFMRILTPVFIEPYAGRLFNIHPSLLPKYPGLNTHQRAIDAGDSEAGVTVHFVTSQLDGGPPVLQAKVPIEEEDNAITLAEKVITLEHKIYTLAISWYLDRRLQLTTQGVSLDGNLLPATGKAYIDGMI